MRYASQPRALGICDRCGRSVRLSTLTNQMIDRRRSNIMVCTSCLDIDQEQLQVSTLDLNDATTLKDPRPDNSDGRLPNDPYVPVFLNSP